MGKNNFSTIKLFRYCWTILRGIFFLPITSVPLITNYFLNTVARQIKPTVLQQKFRAFVTDYLVKKYFSASDPFNPTYWSYFYDINLLSEFNTTRNTSETINKRLKVLCGTGFLPLKLPALN